MLQRLNDRSRLSRRDPNQGSRLHLPDPPKLITRTFNPAKAGLVMGLDFGKPNRPEADQLLGLYALLSGRSRASEAAQLAKQHAGMCS